MRWLTVLLMCAAAAAQELTPQEKDFQESLTGATLAGFFTRGESKELSEDKYTLAKVTKVKDDLWRFEARVQYGGKDVTFPMELEVKWAGDTPVLTLTDRMIPMLGTYTARIVVYRGQYAGTWSGQNNRGGQMFGRIIKQ